MFRAEYPRPSFVRDKWLNLNGKWEFEILGKPENKLGKVLNRSIEIPFCPESRLSGIGYTGFMKNLWYRRKFDLSKDNLSGRVILHFGACYPPAAVGEDNKTAWGYYSTETEEDFIKSYCEITDAIFESDAIGYCYTQLTDVEQEHNGLYYYDRRSKFSAAGMEKIKRCNLQAKKR